MTELRSWSGRRRPWLPRPLAMPLLGLILTLGGAAPVMAQAVMRSNPSAPAPAPAPAPKPGAFKASPAQVQPPQPQPSKSGSSQHIMRSGPTAPKPSSQPGTFQARPPQPQQPKSSTFQARPPQVLTPRATPPKPHGDDFVFKAQRRPPKVVDQLPQGYVPVYRYKDRRRHRPEYYYYRGRYYRPHGHRYITAYPPSGVVVPLLPLGYRTIVYGGVPYYYYDDIYYTQVPSGYLVVDPPSDPALSPQTPPAASPYGPVTVIAEALNVRSGPGMQYEVVAVVRRGETYGVQAIAPEWLYILLPDGQAGWVQEIYTAPAVPRPSG